MTASNDKVSRCGFCQFYSHEGRRGGRCCQLNVPVSSQWKACCLAIAPFTSAKCAAMGIAQLASPAPVSSAESMPLPLPLASRKPRQLASRLANIN